MNAQRTILKKPRTDYSHQSLTGQAGMNELEWQQREPMLSNGKTEIASEFSNEINFRGKLQIHCSSYLMPRPSQPPIPHSIKDKSLMTKQQSSTQIIIFPSNVIPTLFNNGFTEHKAPAFSSQVLKLPTYFHADNSVASQNKKEPVACICFSTLMPLLVSFNSVPKLKAHWSFQSREKQ